MIKKAWVKFNDMTVECICDENDRKCKGDKLCKEYVVKFIEVDRVVISLPYLLLVLQDVFGNDILSQGDEILVRESTGRR